MAADRYVVLGLAAPRAEWFRDVTRWSVSAALPVELVRCVSVEDLRARLASGRRWSAVLVDGGITVELDTDAPVLVVDDGRRAARPHDATVVLQAPLERQALLDALAAHATSLGGTTPATDDVAVDLRDRRAPLAVVLGPGGTGTTTCAAAMAQGLAARRHDVVLADLALHAEQAVLHDVRDVAPGIQELVEHRGDARSLTFEIADRGYCVLLGLRHARHWSTLRPRTVEAAIDSLRRAFGVVVADVTADLDATTADLEERNALARAAVSAADVVFAVGRPTTKGVHALVRVLTELDRSRTVPVLVGAPKHPRQRAELTSVLSDLAHTSSAPLFLPARPVDQAWRDATAMPTPLPDLLAGAFEATYDRLGPALPVHDEPLLVRPGSMGVA